jgi:hypothetical protein
MAGKAFVLDGPAEGRFVDMLDPDVTLNLLVNVIDWDARQAVVHQAAYRLDGRYYRLVGDREASREDLAPEPEDVDDYGCDCGCSCCG